MRLIHMATTKIARETKKKYDIQKLDGFELQKIVEAVLGGAGFGDQFRVWRAVQKHIDIDTILACRGPNGRAKALAEAVRDAVATVKSDEGLRLVGPKEPDRSLIDTAVAVAGGTEQASHRARMIAVMLLTYPDCSEEEAQRAYESVCDGFSEGQRDYMLTYQATRAALYQFADSVRKLREHAAFEARAAKLIEERGSKFRVLLGGKAR
jgi:hypothetical protein